MGAPAHVALADADGAGADGRRPAKAQASLDGRAFADMPLRRKTTRNGQAIEESVPCREYRAIRWDAGDLAAGGSLPFTIRVRVIDERN